MDDGICLLEFDEPGRIDLAFGKLQGIQTEIICGDHPHLKVLKSELDEYFSGHRKAFSLPLMKHGTTFQQEVWTQLQTIPYGKTSTYSRMAMAMNNPGAVRAVGHANAMNTIAILIPCHRVISENGKLTGYGGGIWRKKWLLDHERRHNPEMMSLLFE